MYRIVYSIKHTLLAQQCIFNLFESSRFIPLLIDIAYIAIHISDTQESLHRIYIILQRRAFSGFFNLFSNLFAEVKPFVPRTSEQIKRGKKMKNVGRSV